MRVVLAPDSFKGSADARAVARAMADGVREAGGEHDVFEIPMADGGEGTMDVIIDSWGVAPIFVDAVDAVGRPCRAAYALDGSRSRAVVEIAPASGLPMVSDVPLRPLTASTVGTGILLRAALDAGATTIYFGLGGSATSDAGIGCLAALGGRLLDAEGRELAPVTENLPRLMDFDLSGLHPRAAETEWILTVDVTNPLTGHEGAAAVFGPQKGASPEQVAQLETGLKALGHALYRQSGRNVAELPGTGAAGGVAALFLALFTATVRSGSALVAELVGLSKALTGADLVITGEGHCDNQSLGRKVVSRVAEMARSAGVARVVVIAGQVDCSLVQLQAAGIVAAFSIANGPATPEQLVTNTLPRVRAVTGQVVSVSSSQKHRVAPFHPQKIGIS